MKITIRNWAWRMAFAGGLWLGALSLSAQVRVENQAETNTAVRTNAPAAEPAPAQGGPALTRSEDDHGIQRGPIVVFGRSVELNADQSAETVVVIGGSATIHGKVQEAVVAIGGDVEIDGDVGETAVAVLGRVTLQPGARVHGDTVAVGGGLTIDDGAVVHGDAVSVGGTVELAKGAKVDGQVQEVDVHIPGLGRLDGLSRWVRYCLLELRPLAPQVRWVWIVAGIYTLLYFLVALVFPRPVRVCVEELTRRPATTFGVGLLVKLLVPVVVVVLAMTGIGVLALPFLAAALFFATIVGKVALLEYMGGALGRLFRVQAMQGPLVGFWAGTVLLTLLYLVPVLGFIAYFVFGLWGLGVATTGAFGKMRRERPLPPPAGPPASGPSAPIAAVSPLVPPVTGPAVGGAGGAGEGEGATSPAGAVPPVLQPPVQPNVHAALAFPKGGFWERMGAGFLDLVIVSLLGAVVGGVPYAFLVALAYFAGMWAWRGTTVGGIVLRLQVVRQDGETVTFLVALVRALAAALSIIVLFLGFFWIGWDADKQGWHDKIAGTYVVRLPHSVPLVCF